MVQYIVISILGALFRAIEWPFLFFRNRSLASTNETLLSSRAGDLEGYQLQMDQTKALLAFRRDALSPLMEGLTNGHEASVETDEKLRAFLPLAVAVRNKTTHRALGLVPLVMQECETLDFRSEAGRKRLDDYRQAIDDVERATSDRRQELKKLYPATPLLMGTPEDPAV